MEQIMYGSGVDTSSDSDYYPTSSTNIHQTNRSTANFGKMYHYLPMILRQISSRITAMQIHLAHGKEFQSTEPKQMMAESRKTIRSSLKHIRKMQKSEYTAYVMVRMLREQKESLQQIFDQIKVGKVIDSFRVGFLLADMIYDTLICQIEPLSDSDRDDAIDDLRQPLIDGQSIVNYFASCVPNKQIKHIREFKLELETLSILTHFPFVYVLLIFRDFVQMVNKLQLFTFYAFIRHKKYENDTMVDTTFGIIIKQCSYELSAQIIPYCEELQSVNTLNSLMQNSECTVSHLANCTVIECIMKHVKTKQNVKPSAVTIYRADYYDTFTDKVRHALLNKFGEEIEFLNSDFNYTVYRFDSSYMDSMQHINFKALEFHSFIYTALLLIGRLNERLFVANLLQNEKYQAQINEYIDFLRLISKESKQINHTLHTKLPQMQRQNKKVILLRNQILMAWALTKITQCLPKCGGSSSNKNNSIDSMTKPSFISPQRMEKNECFQRYPYEKKLEYIAANAAVCKFQNDVIIFSMQTWQENKRKSCAYTKPISFALSYLGRAWRQIGDEHPSFKHLKLIVQYHQSLLHLVIPVGNQRLLKIMLAMAQKHGADEVILFLKYKDLNFEVELEMNGEPWTLPMIELMDKQMRAEYGQLDMKYIERSWRNRVLQTLTNTHQFNGHCGVRRIGKGNDKTVINKSFYCQWPLHRFNPSFDYDEWFKKHGHKAFKTREFSF